MSSERAYFVSGRYILDCFMFTFRYNDRDQNGFAEMLLTDIYIDGIFSFSAEGDPKVRLPRTISLHRNKSWD